MQKFLPFIGREPTTWPANNCLQIMVCSCAMSFNCFWVSFWLQILFCSCVNETMFFSFLRSLLLENGRSLRFPKIFLKKQTRWSNDKTISELGYRRSIICLSLRLRQIIDLLATDKSRYFAQPRPIIANYYSTSLSRVRIMLKTSTNISRYFYSRSLVWLVSVYKLNVAHAGRKCSFLGKIME